MGFYDNPPFSQLFWGKMSKTRFRALFGSELSRDKKIAHWVTRLKCQKTIFGDFDIFDFKELFEGIFEFLKIRIFQT